jgi:hypothetical protein
VFVRHVINQQRPQRGGGGGEDGAPRTINH